MRLITVEVSTFAKVSTPVGITTLLAPGEAEALTMALDVIRRRIGQPGAALVGRVVK